MSKKKNKVPLCDIRLLEAKPNPIFEEWQRQITVFLHYTKNVRCAWCGRRGKYFWTQLRFFRIAEGFEAKGKDGKVRKAMGFQLTDGKEIFPPLTPVCQKHILKPILP